MGCVVDEDGLGEGAANIDADTIGAGWCGRFGQASASIV
jgi:hypothetical protein